MSFEQNRHYIACKARYIPSQALGWSTTSLSFTHLLFPNIPNRNSTSLISWYLTKKTNKETNKKWNSHKTCLVFVKCYVHIRGHWWIRGLNRPSPRNGTLVSRGEAVVGMWHTYIIMQVVDWDKVVWTLGKTWIRSNSTVWCDAFG